MKAARLEGKMFGRLKVLARHPKKSKGGAIRWECKCICGNRTVVTSADLNNGTSKSCGCYRRELLFGIKTIHGEAIKGKTSSEYEAWHSIIQRCENINHSAYKNYGGRGISICKKWRNSFKAFLRDVGRKPSLNHTIERINNDGNYDPSNVIWDIVKNQSRNKRNNVWIEFGGETMIQADWSKRTGIHPSTISQRLKMGWDINRVLSKTRYMIGATGN